MEALRRQLEEIVSPILSDENVDLVDLQIKGKPGSLIFKIFVDMPGGITLDECEKISRRLSDQLDIVDIVSGKYRLEVSSPGLDRPLLNRADFMRNLDRMVNVTFEDSTGLQHFHGKIESVTENSVQIHGKPGKKDIPLSMIKKGMLSLPW